MGETASRMVGLIGAAALPATVAGIMFTLERWDWQVLAMVVVLSLPLYAVGRDSARARPHRDRLIESSPSLRISTRLAARARRSP